MGFISLSFLAFLGVAVLIYYLLPSKIQWVWLLIVSLLFYLTFDLRYIAFLLLSIATTWGGALAVYRLRKTKKRRRQSDSCTHAACQYRIAGFFEVRELFPEPPRAYSRAGRYQPHIRAAQSADAHRHIVFNPFRRPVTSLTFTAAGKFEKNPAKVHPVHGFLSPDSAGTDPSIRPASPRSCMHHTASVMRRFCSGMR